MVRGAHVVVRAGETTTTTTTRDEEEQCGDGRSGRRGVVVGSASLAVLAAAAMTTWGAGEARAAGDAVLELTPENFEREVTRREGGGVRGVSTRRGVRTVKRLEPIWEELPEKLEEAGSKTRVARMDVDAYAEYASAYAVTGFPTLMLFENGRPVGAKTGLVDMTTAMKYAGVRDEGVLAKFAPEKTARQNSIRARRSSTCRESSGRCGRNWEGFRTQRRARARWRRCNKVEAIVGVRAL
jgi:hypothetical protein